jgi:hypothetical protein
VAQHRCVRQTVGTWLPCCFCTHHTRTRLISVICDPSLLPYTYRIGPPVRAEQHCLNIRLPWPLTAFMSSHQLIAANCLSSPGAGLAIVIVMLQCRKRNAKEAQHATITMCTVNKVKANSVGRWQICDVNEKSIPSPCATRSHDHLPPAVLELAPVRNLGASERLVPKTVCRTIQFRPCMRLADLTEVVSKPWQHHIGGMPLATIRGVAG